jgi:hypothetical protein
MRRGIAFVSLLLVLMGLELSTEAISLVVERIAGGLSALVGGTEPRLPGFRFVAGLGALVVGLGLWILLIWSGRKGHGVDTSGDACPQCGADTRRVRRRGWQRLLAVLVGERMTRRKCETCGWVGLSLRR